MGDDGEWVEEKQVLVLDGYDHENLLPIKPGDAMYQPGETVTISMGDYEGESGVVQAVGFAGGVLNRIVADVLIEGTSDAERFPQDWLEG